MDPISAVVATPSPALSVNETPEPLTAPPKLRAEDEIVEPALVLIVVAASRVIALSLSPILTGPLAITLPARRIALGTAAVNPPLNVTVSPAESPN